MTLADAFHTLKLTRAHGDPIERNLAGLSLEMLHDVRQELELYQGLQNAYVAVANAPPGPAAGADPAAQYGGLHQTL